VDEKWKRSRTNESVIICHVTANTLIYDMKKSVKHLSFLRLTFAIIVTGFILGCATGPPTANERAKVQVGKQAVVLLRITCESEDKTPVEAFPKSLGDPIIIGKASPIIGGKIEIISDLFTGRFFSPETRKQGWTFLFLKPGIHYLIFAGTASRLEMPYAPRYKVNIPKTGPVFYIGSMHLYCANTWNFGMKYCPSFDTERMVISNEEIQAKTLLKDHLSDLGSLQTVLMERQ